MLLKHIKKVTLRAAPSLATRTIALAPMRTYAQVASEPDSKPPIALYGLDGTYASALVRSLSSDISQINVVQGILL